ncbi:MAG: hypothetical protein ACXVRW_13415 [Solirubrobacteraceae bacterium]
MEIVWLRPTLIPRESPELAPDEAPVREITGVVVDELLDEVLVPVEPTEDTLPTTLMLLPEEPDPETTGVPEGFPATVPGLVTVPEPPTTVVTVPTGLLEPEPELPLPEPAATPVPELTTGTGVEATGVVGVGVVGVVGVLVVPLPEVGVEDPVLRLGVVATGREMEAEPEPWWETRTGEPAREVAGVDLAAPVVAGLPAWVTARGLTTATAARPRDEEWTPAFGCAVSVCVAGAPIPPSFGQPL